MQFEDLEGRRVAVWGAGREGRAALTALAERLPSQPVTLLCHPREAVEVAAIAAHCDVPRQLTTATEPADAAALSAFDVVIKSPGISAYQPELLAARDNGVRFTSGTALWFGENPDATVIGITGSKGKSTTSAVVAHLARSLGIRTALAGNIGVPLLELLGQAADLWVVELSSFQTGEAGALAVGVVTSLFPEHLDWHGSAERYVADKLKLAARARRLLVNGTCAELLQATAAHPHRQLFGVPPGWYVGGDAHDGARSIMRGAGAVVEAAVLPLPGAHNRLNACAALAALELAGFDAVAAATSLADFQPLPHRLQVLGERDGLTWVDDSIATTPNATLAAIDSLTGRPLGVIVGGHDRGVDWDGFASAVGARDKLHFLVQGGNGVRITAALAAAGVVNVTRCSTLEQAVARARAELPRGATVALSPGAPSFDQFANYRERGRRFAELAGFEPGEVSRIQGLGIA